MRFYSRALLAAALLIGTVGAQDSAVSADTAPTGRWMPGADEPWQWVLDGPLDLNDPMDMTGGASSQPTTFSIDGFENPASTVAALHARGYRVICYVSVGSWENYRPDAASFPAATRGNKVSGWAGEKWLDIRRIDLLRPVMTARFKMCADKGFDAVEPDLMDAYTNRSGFPLTAQDQLTYNRWVADTVHSLGMSVLLKGDPEQAAQLEPWFEFALNEECAQYDECGAYAPFFSAGKTVLNVEYSGTLASFCPESNVLGMNTMKKKLALDGWRRPCA